VYREKKYSGERYIYPTNQEIFFNEVKFSIMKQTYFEQKKFYFTEEDNVLDNIIT